MSDLFAAIVRDPEGFGVSLMLMLLVAGLSLLIAGFRLQHQAALPQQRNVDRLAYALADVIDRQMIAQRSLDHIVERLVLPYRSIQPEVDVKVVPFAEARKTMVDQLRLGWRIVGYVEALRTGHRELVFVR
jgi:hypothetical protein